MIDKVYNIHTDFSLILLLFVLSLKFRVIRLPNSLEVLLISDENLTTSFSREKKV